VELRDRGIPVSSQILAIELLCVNSQLISVDVINLHHCILRVMKNIHVAHRCITYNAQNTYFHEQIFYNFITCTNWQIVTGKYEANQVFNIDQTNVDFDEISSITSCEVGRATVMLAVTMSGQKLPAFFI
jgi:hypothetical protein